MSRGRGRPVNEDRPVVPWEDVDRLLVFGELREDPETGQSMSYYPSYAELGRRFGVSKSRIGQYARAESCLDRRQAAQASERTEYERKMIETRAEARAVTAAEEVAIIDEYVRRFHDALLDGSVRVDSPADLDRLLRLKAFRLGEADSRTEVVGVSLDEIRRRLETLDESDVEDAAGLSGEEASEREGLH